MKDTTLELHRTLEEAGAHYTQGQLNEARDCLVKAQALAPQSLMVLNALGAVYFQIGEFKAAADCFGRLVESHPGYPQAFTRFAATCRCLGRDQDFIIAIDKALALCQDDAEALQLLARHLLDGGQYLRAARIYHRLAGLIPQDVTVLLFLGKCFYHLHDHDTARDVHQRALELDARNEIARTNLMMLSGRTSGQDEDDDEIIFFAA